jgi:hypothetical protein
MIVKVKFYWWMRLQKGGFVLNNYCVIIHPSTRPAVLISAPNLHLNGSPQIKQQTLGTVTRHTQNKEGIDCPVETESKLEQQRRVTSSPLRKYTLSCTAQL